MYGFTTMIIGSIVVIGGVVAALVYASRRRGSK